tara:strand:- start:7536 stop:9419 length:1884 start_codon:yes stop_codon:yes gene_type:complete
MIPKETIDLIFESSKIEEVIADYLPDLKKKGTNYWACCPFHNEKTPSFSVSPSKGIYKCFGCGKGGNVVNFIMDHEGLSYPESLKELAKKYNIEIEDVKLSPEQIAISNKKESVYLISKYANNFFQNQLWETNEGKLIGLSYLRNRKFSENIIKQFELGYSPEIKNALIKQATKDSYEKDFLIESGLAIINKNSEVDRFNNRIIFPIHNSSGKIIGFGGRSIKNNNRAKYLNSPENPIYQKSKVLYGLYFSKNEINKKNNCYIVEGYTDVISMHENGIKNVVSVSGTALSSDQINLIRRFTNNITLLFDGDEAGLKASFKNIDLILKEGMNVNIVMFPASEDPDSYSKKLTNEEYLSFLNENSKDFIKFKSELLKKNYHNDPVKKVESISDIARSIAMIPNRLLRHEYCKVSSSLLSIAEEDLIFEMSKFLESPKKIKSKDDIVLNKNQKIKTTLIEECEKEILRLLFNYGDKILEFEENRIKVCEYILHELEKDSITFSNTSYLFIWEKYFEIYKIDNTHNINYFLKNTEDEVQQIVISLLSKKHEISNKWEEIHNIYIKDESQNLEKSVEKSILNLKQAFIKKEIYNLNEIIKSEKNDSTEILFKVNKLNKALVIINKILGRNFN